ncbi:hypothetical protein E2C01_051613 [Portunus trituberculatus]|uniref:Uncharacterized protein n=1 Tax=Portunus trituberculatus TaxID=210409 RepID=A0A5B7GKT5_PORTR|nr:hypothetical protein [Portunus trituberculatus]
MLKSTSPSFQNAKFICDLVASDTVVESVESYPIDKELLGQLVRSADEVTASCRATPKLSPQQAITEYTLTSSSL